MIEIIGEIIEIKEVANGIIGVKIEYKKDGKLLEEVSYTIADSPTAIAEFQNNVCLKELNNVKDKDSKGEYDNKEEIKPKPPKEKVYKIKVGDKVQ